VPIILAAYVVQGWGNVTQFGISASQRTKYMSYSTWAGVAVVMVLYATMIPAWGGYGAALATLGAFIVRFATGYYWSHQLWPVSYSWGRNLRLAGYSSVLVLAAFLIPAQGIAAQFGLGLGLLAVYAGLTWTTFLDPDDRRLIVAIARSPRQLGTIMRPSAG
jgi:O-antigen/teichoic acid export membrane protein